MSVYLDDAGSADSPVAVIGGLVARESVFQFIEARWRQILSKYQWQEIHATDLPRFMLNLSPQARLEAMREIVSAITDSRAYPIGAGIAFSDYDDMRKRHSWFGEWAKEPLTFCFHATIQTAANYAKSRGETLAVMMDTPGRLAGHSSRALNAYREAAGWEETVKSVTFGSRKDYLPLQCADFVVHEMFLDFKRWKTKSSRPRRASFEALLADCYVTLPECFVHVGPNVLDDLSKKMAPRLAAASQGRRGRDSSDGENR